jgi:hypothetical protein
VQFWPWRLAAIIMVCVEGVCLFFVPWASRSTPPGVARVLMSGHMRVCLQSL